MVGTAAGHGDGDGSRGASVRAAVLDVAAVGPGMTVLGVSFGLLVVSSGLHWWWAPVFSAVVYAGSLEFLLVPLALAGTPLGAVALTALLVNGRHAFYGLSFPLHRVRGRLARAYSVFALIDEAYALVATRPEDGTHTRILATQVLLQASWVSGGMLGALAGAGLALRVPALDFVFVGLFVVLALDAIREARDAVTPLIGLAAALVARWVAPVQMVLAAMVLLLVALLVRHRVGRGRAGRGRVDRA